MAVCTKCGVILHEDDMNTHTCSDEDKPKKGQPIKFKKEV